MAEPRDLLKSARDILAAAARDLDRGWHESACVSAHRAAAMATQAWLESRGQVHVSASVSENVALEPGADRALLAAAARLDRHRIDEGTPYRPADVDADDAARAVEDGRRVVDFAEAWTRR